MGAGDSPPGGSRVRLGPLSPGEAGASVPAPGPGVASEPGSLELRSGPGVTSVVKLVLGVASGPGSPESRLGGLES